MTNEDVIARLEGCKTTVNIGIREPMWDWIMANYKEGDSPNPHYKLYCAGYDSKYTRRAVDPLTMTYRGLTFDEFYGNGVVD